MSGDEVCLNCRWWEPKEQTNIEGLCHLHAGGSFRTTPDTPEDSDDFRYLPAAFPWPKSNREDDWCLMTIDDFSCPQFEEMTDEQVDEWSSKKPA